MVDAQPLTDDGAAISFAIAIVARAKAGANAITFDGADVDRCDRPHPPALLGRAPNVADIDELPG
jgi:hypothetical protein